MSEQRFGGRRCTWLLANLHSKYFASPVYVVTSEFRVLISLSSVRLVCLWGEVSCCYVLKWSVMQPLGPPIFAPESVCIPCAHSRKPIGNLDPLVDHPGMGLDLFLQDQDPKCSHRSQQHLAIPRAPRRPRGVAEGQPALVGCEGSCIMPAD